MANTTIGFAIALIALGLLGYFGTGTTSLTALIPALFGLLLLLLGLMARRPERRKMAMHIAVVIGVLGFAGSVRGLTKLPDVLGGDPVERSEAVMAQSAMAVLMAIYVLLCVKSFVDARRRRTV
jgi:hypothetical protein